MLLFSCIIDCSHVLCLWDGLLFLTKREQQHWLSEGHSLLLAKSHNCALACCFTAVAPTLVYMWRVSQQRQCVIINLWNAAWSSFTAPTFVFLFCLHFIFDPWLIVFIFVILVWYLLNWFLVSYSSILEVLVLVILILMVILPFNVLWSLVFCLTPWLFLVAVCASLCFVVTLVLLTLLTMSVSVCFGYFLF